MKKREYIKRCTYPRCSLEEPPQTEQIWVTTSQAIEQFTSFQITISPYPQTTTILFYTAWLSFIYFWTVYKRNHTVKIHLYLAAFAQHYICDPHSQTWVVVCSSDSLIFILNGIPCTNIPQFTLYNSRASEHMGFLVWGYCN